MLDVCISQRKSVNPVIRRALGYKSGDSPSLNPFDDTVGSHQVRICGLPIPASQSNPYLRKETTPPKPAARGPTPRPCRNSAT